MIEMVSMDTAAGIFEELALGRMVWLGKTEPSSALTCVTCLVCGVSTPTAAIDITTNRDGKMTGHRLTVTRSIIRASFTPHIAYVHLNMSTLVILIRSATKEEPGPTPQRRIVADQPSTSEEGNTTVQMQQAWLNDHPHEHGKSLLGDKKLQDEEDTEGMYHQPKEAALVSPDAALNRKRRQNHRQATQRHDRADNESRS